MCQFSSYGKFFLTCVWIFLLSQSFLIVWMISSRLFSSFCFFSLADEVDEVKDGDELTSELEILDEELDLEAELLDEQLRVFTFWLGFFEGFAIQKNLVHLPENRFWNPKSESRIIENDARIQK